MKEINFPENALALIDSLNITDNSIKDILIAMIKQINSLNEEVSTLKAKLEETAEYAELLEQDMDRIKEEIFGEEILDPTEEKEDFEYVEIKCSNCGESIYVEKALMNEAVYCPNCDNKLF